MKSGSPSESKKREGYHMAEGDYDRKQIQTQAADTLAKASVLTVNDTASWCAAREVRRMAKLLDAQAEKHYKEVKAPVNKARADILALENRDREPMQSCMEQLDPQILSYEENEKALREDLQRRAEADAKRQAEDSRFNTVQLLRQSGLNDQADELEKKPLYVAPVVVPEGMPLLDGEGRLETWVMEVLDINTLLQAVLDGRVPANVIEPNEKVLNGLARTLKEMCSIPGCAAKKKRSITQR
jgi:hypothetical protein